MGEGGGRQRGRGRRAGPSLGCSFSFVSFFCYFSFDQFFFGGPGEKERRGALLVRLFIRGEQARGINYLSSPPTLSKIQKQKQPKVKGRKTWNKSRSFPQEGQGAITPPPPEVCEITHTELPIKARLRGKSSQQSQDSCFDSITCWYQCFVI